MLGSIVSWYAYAAIKCAPIPNMGMVETTWSEKFASDKPYFYLQLSFDAQKNTYVLVEAINFANKTAPSASEPSLEKHLKERVNPSVSFYEKPFLGPITGGEMDNLTQEMLLGGETPIEGMNGYPNRVELWKTKREGKEFFFAIFTRPNPPFYEVIDASFCNGRDVQKETISDILLRTEMSALFTPHDKLLAIKSFLDQLGKFREFNSTERKVEHAKEALNFSVIPIEDSMKDSFLKEKGASGNPLLVDEYIQTRIAKKTLEEDVLAFLRNKFIEASGKEEPAFNVDGWKIDWKSAGATFDIRGLDKDSARVAKIKELRAGLSEEDFWNVVTQVFKPSWFSAANSSKRGPFSEYLNSIFKFTIDPAKPGYYRTEEIFGSLPDDKRYSVKTAFVSCEGLERLKEVSGFSPRQLAERMALVKTLMRDIGANEDKLKAWLKESFTGDILYFDARLRFEQSGSWGIPDETMRELAKEPYMAHLAEITDIPTWKSMAKDFLIKNAFLHQNPNDFELAVCLPETVIAFLKKGKL